MRFVPSRPLKDWFAVQTGGGVRLLLPTERSQRQEFSHPSERTISSGAVSRTAGWPTLSTEMVSLGEGVSTAKTSNSVHTHTHTHTGCGLRAERRVSPHHPMESQCPVIDSQPAGVEDREVKTACNRYSSFSLVSLSLSPFNDITRFELKATATAPNTQTHTHTQQPLPPTTQ